MNEWGVRFSYSSFGYATGYVEVKVLIKVEDQIKLRLVRNVIYCTSMSIPILCKASWHNYKGVISHVKRDTLVQLADPATYFPVQNEKLSKHFVCTYCYRIVDWYQFGSFNNKQLENHDVSYLDRYVLNVKYLYYSIGNNT